MLHKLRLELDTVRESLKSSEGQRVKLTEEVSQLRVEKANMVDKKQYDSAALELQTVKASLHRETDERNRLDDALSKLRQRELELMSTQQSLQSEARILAIELAQKTASVDSIAAVRTSRQSRTVDKRNVSPPRHKTTSPPRAPESTSHLQERSNILRDVSAQSHHDASMVETRRHYEVSHASPRRHADTNETPLFDFTAPREGSSSADELLRMIKVLDDRVSGALHGPH